MLLDVGQESFGVGPVDNAMIKAERKVRHVTNGDVILVIRGRQNFCPLLDLANAENGYLWLIDDRRAEQPTKDTRIRDGEGAAGHFIRLKLFGARAIGEVIGRACQS